MPNIDRGKESASELTTNMLEEESDYFFEENLLEFKKVMGQETYENINDLVQQRLEESLHQSTRQSERTFGESRKEQMELLNNLLKSEYSKFDRKGTVGGMKPENEKAKDEEEAAINKSEHFRFKDKGV